MYEKFNNIPYVKQGIIITLGTSSKLNTLLSEEYHLGYNAI
jgi:hypothetical protein